MADDRTVLDATGQAELVRRGDASPLELVDAAIERIERLDPEINAVIHHRFSAARAEAASVAAGPFAGVPIVIKDLDCPTAGDPHHCGMRLLKELDWTEHEDASVVDWFRDAGFVIVGRTNTPELGLMPTTEPQAYGPTRNPWDLSRSPGGSSGGSAAAVAAGMVPVAHATDSGGSIRIPASACGVVGLKPSRGPGPVGRVGDLAGFNAQYVITRSVRDSAALRRARGRPRMDVDGGVVPLRIGLMTSSPGGVLPVHADCVSAAEDAALLLGSLGHVVEPAHPPALDELEHILHYGAVTAVDALARLGQWSGRTGRSIGPGDVEPGTWMLAEMGRSITGDQVRASLEWLSDYTRRVVSWWEEGFDLLLTPTLAEPPPPLGELVPTPDEPFKAAWRAGAIVPFTPPFNTTGQPAISLPLFWNAEGLPIGVQLVAGPGAEDVLFRVAAQLERARPWAKRRPPVAA